MKKENLKKTGSHLADTEGMKKGKATKEASKTELVFILDRSGSMGGLESDTIGGFNGMLAKQKKLGSDARVTTVLFDDRYELLHDRVDISRVKLMTSKEYYVRGCTALLDAIGRTVATLEAEQKDEEKANTDKKVIFVITTDGMENASREYRADQVRKMIQKHEKEGWEFLFLGANMDAVAEAGKFGIREDRAVSFVNDSKGIALNYAEVGEAISVLRTEKSGKRMSGSWKNKIVRDYESRKDG